MTGNQREARSYGTGGQRNAATADLNVEAKMAIGGRKVRASVAGSGVAYGSASEPGVVLAPFLRDPAAAKRTGVLPLKPPTRSGRAYGGAGP